MEFENKLRNELDYLIDSLRGILGETKNLDSITIELKADSKFGEVTTTITKSYK